jgi:hypothetical protein
MAVRQYSGMIKKPTDHPDVQQLIAILDKALSANAHDLKAAKIKGERDATLIKLRANYARTFIDAIEAFLVSSDSARTLRRSLGRKTKGAKGHGTACHEGSDFAPKLEL